MKAITIALLFAAALAAAAGPPGGITPIIFGKDDRQDAGDAVGAEKAWADAAPAIIHHRIGALSEDKSELVLTAEPYTKDYEDRPLCPDVRFYGQPQAVMCSSALVGKRLILTAGHCAEKLDCSPDPDQPGRPSRLTRPWIAFGVAAGGGKPAPSRLPAKQAYRCVKAEHAHGIDAEGGEEDWALLVLDRDVPDHKPLEVDATPFAKGDPVAAAGYPDGLPLKIVGGATIRDRYMSVSFANLDGFIGLSGAPAIRPGTGKVAGVVIGGDEHAYTFDHKRQCSTLYTAPDDLKTRSEVYSRIAHSSQFIAVYRRLKAQSEAPAPKPGALKLNDGGPAMKGLKSFDK